MSDYRPLPSAQTQRDERMLITAARYQRRRHWIDRLAGGLIAVGGVGVIVTVLLIFVYLLLQALPLLGGASVSEPARFTVAELGGTPIKHLAVVESGDGAVAIGEDGTLNFFRLADGALIRRAPLPVPNGQSVTAVAIDADASGMVAAGLDSGGVILVRYSWSVSFTETGDRRLEPRMEFPFGAEPISLGGEGAVAQLAVRLRGESVLLAAVNLTGRLQLLRLQHDRSPFAVALDLPNTIPTRSHLDLGPVMSGPHTLYLDQDQRWLLAIDAGGMARQFDLQAAWQDRAATGPQPIPLVSDDARPTAISWLAGGQSLLVADDQGTITQWFMVQSEGRSQWQQIRSFDVSGGPVVALAVEPRRRGFAVLDANGVVGLYHSTSQRRLFQESLARPDTRAMALSPRGDLLLLQDSAGNFSTWAVDNPHPEVSWQALWSRVWYEGYPAPDFIWQSSAAADDYEPKYSLAPLAFGTLKAAFYAMLLAAPLAICGAIFTGYFMNPVMRQQVKPLVELMAAMPTVVLGFLAGLWLAPFVEAELLGVLALPVTLALTVVAASYLWYWIPSGLRQRIPDGWEAAILVPIVVITILTTFVGADAIDQYIFAGDFRGFLSTRLGIDYDQRNALIVGLAMGFAVVPVVFSIAEDAIFSVPRHLTDGSLALGATPWQSLFYVVLPTASPGIFSALMIGFGRAVGETMIVLMATGNTPIWDANLFTGMRTLAANLAVEIPESGVGTTHFRILFLSALVLFLFTFLVNTVAEVIRQRLRHRYGGL